MGRVRRAEESEVDWLRFESCGAFCFSLLHVSRARARVVHVSCCCRANAAALGPSMDQLAPAHVSFLAVENKSPLHNQPAHGARFSRRLRLFPTALRLHGCCKRKKGTHEIFEII